MRFVRPMRAKTTILAACTIAGMVGDVSTHARGAGQADSPGAVRSDNMAERMIRKEVTVSASLDQVWHAWTTTEGATSFFAPAAKIALRVGGPYELYFAPDAVRGSRGSEGCRVLSYLPTEMLSFSWNAPPKFPNVRKERTCVVLQFEDLGDGRVKVRMSHHGSGGGEEWDRVFAYFERAWDTVLGNFEKRFDSGPLSWPNSDAKGPDQPERAEKLHFVYFVRPAREGFFEQPTDAENEAIHAHVRYLERLLAEDAVLLAGRCYDPPHYPESGTQMVKLDMPTPGIVVFETDNVEHATRIMEADPAVTAGVFKARLCRFNPTFVRK